MAATPSQNDIGLIITGVHALGLPPDEVNRLTGILSKALAPKPADEVVEGWEPAPPLLSDKDYTFGAGINTVTVKLKILGGDWYLSEFLPRFGEWVTALYRGRAVEALQASQLKPVTFILDVIRQILNRPKNDRLKVSFYEFAGETFSNPDAIVTSQFFAVCPPDQQMGSIMRLVATNRANFHGLWAEMPTLLKYQASLLYFSLLELIQNANANVISYMSSMSMETQKSHSNGGLQNTGPDAYTWPPVAGSENTSPS